MINDFIEKTIKLLQCSDIIIRIPENRKLEIEGVEKLLCIKTSEVYCQMELQENLIIHVMIFFTLLDTYIDIRYPNLEGESFAKKYCNLKVSNDMEVMIREIYRILKMFRNASIHSRNAICVRDDNVIIVDYPFRGTNFKLEMSKSCLELIYTLIFLIIKDNKYPIIYIEGLMRTYYDDIKSSVTISDDFGTNNLTSISSGLRLKRIVRYEVENPTFTIDSNTQMITINKNQLCEWEQEHCSIDYKITVDGKCYLIPDETLEEGGVINISDLTSWAIP